MQLRLAHTLSKPNAHSLIYTLHQNVVTVTSESILKISLIPIIISFFIPGLASCYFNIFTSQRFGAL